MMAMATTEAIILNEPSSAFDPNRDVKDRKLAQIFKKLHMEQDLESLLHFDNGNRRSLEAVSDQSEELNAEKTERCRPRKVLNYALLAKGQRPRMMNPLGVRTSKDPQMDDADKNGVTGKRIRFQKRQFEEYVPIAKRRMKIGQGSASRKCSRPQRCSLPLPASDTGKKERPRSRSLTQGNKGSILKGRAKNADNIKQAFLISQSVLVAQNNHFEEFIIPDEWIKEAQKNEGTKKMRTEVIGGNESSTSVEDLAMERLVRAFKAAKLLYPEKFAKYFPDFMHCFEADESKEKSAKRNGLLQKGKRLDEVKQGGATAAGNRNTSDSGDEGVSKHARKTPKVLQDNALGADEEKKKPSGRLSREKRLPDSKEQPATSQKITRISGGSSAGVSGLRKRRKSSVDTAVKRKASLNGNAESTKEEIVDVEEINKNSAPSRQKCSSANTRKASRRPINNSTVAKLADLAAVIENNIEDSAAESSSDESSNVRMSKRQRAQSGFYKTMVTLYDKRRST